MSVWKTTAVISCLSLLVLSASILAQQNVPPNGEAKAKDAGVFEGRAGLKVSARIVHPKKVAAPNRVANLFASPTLIRGADGKPLIAPGKIPYPSPAIFDVDDDGVDELVLGSLTGEISVCENTNKEAGEPVWTKPKPIKTAAGEPLELNNW